MSARHHRFLSSVLGATLAMFVTAAGCSLITKTDRSKIPSGSEGGGGTTSTTGGGGDGAGGSGTTTSTGGSTTCTAECCDNFDCPTPDSECVLRLCQSGKCTTAPVDEGVPVSTQSAGDCKKIVCDGAGSTKAVLDAADIPEDQNECTVDKCVSGQPKNTFAPAGQACSQDNGKKDNASNGKKDSPRKARQNTKRNKGGSN